MTHASASAARPTRRLQAALAAAAAVWGLVVVLVPLLPAPLLARDLWAFRHLVEVPLGVRVLLAAAGLAAVRPGLNRTAWRAFEAASAAAGRLPAAARRAGAATGLFALFWLLRARNFTLGDSAFLVGQITRKVHATGQHVTFDEPLELLVHSWAYRLLHALADATVATTYALLSSLAGVAAVFLVVALWRRVTPAPDARLVAAMVVLSAGAMQLFCGYVENYTLVACGILLYLLLAERTLAGRLHPAWPTLALSTAVAFHVLAGWLYPTLAYLWLARPGARGPARLARDAAAMALAGLVPVAATFGVCAAVGHGPGEVTQTHLWQAKFIFLLDADYPKFQHPFLSRAHLADVLNELVLTGLSGLLALGVALGTRHAGAARRPARFTVLLALVAGLFQVFAATWHPDLGAYRDWDLFAVVGLGYALLGAALLVERLDPASLRHAGLVIAVVALGQSGTWIATNTRAQGVPPPRHHAVHFGLAQEAQRAGRFEEAHWHLEQAVRAEPGVAAFQFALGNVARELGRRDEALQHYRRYLRMEPDGRYAAAAAARVQELTAGPGEDDGDR